MSGRMPVPGGGEAEGQPPERWVLTLYVSGASPHSAAAVDALHRLCDNELSGAVQLNIVDVHDEPALLLEDHVLATPTLVKRLPPPLRRLVGNLTDAKRVRIGLDLQEAHDPRPIRPAPEGAPVERDAPEDREG